MNMKIANTIKQNETNTGHEACPLDAIVKQTNGDKPFLLSVYDYTGNWARPYIEAGWKVLLWDAQIEGCILKRFTTLQFMIEKETGGKIDGLLAAPPCTASAGSGALHWPEKDSGWPELHRNPEMEQTFETFTQYMTALTEIVLHMKDIFDPSFWALEQPVGRSESLVPELRRYKKMIFQPNEFGDPYTKRTVIFGQFNTDLPRNFVEAKEGSKMWKIPPGPERKKLRSATPKAFAKAFYQANNEKTTYRKQLDMQFA